MPELTGHINLQMGAMQVLILLNEPRLTLERNYYQNSKQMTSLHALN